MAVLALPLIHSLLIDRRLIENPSYKTTHKIEFKSITMSIQVEPDSQGNITITIKLMIAGAGVKTEIVATVEEQEESIESVQSEDLLQSDSSDSDTVIEGANKEDKNDDANKSKAPAYSLRSRIQVEDNDTVASNGSGGRESHYEVDYALSQQVNSMGLYH